MYIHTKGYSIYMSLPVSNRITSGAVHFKGILPHWLRSSLGGLGLGTCQNLQSATTKHNTAHTHTTLGHTFEALRPHFSVTSHTHTHTHTHARMHAHAHTHIHTASLHSRHSKVLQHHAGDCGQSK